MERAPRPLQEYEIKLMDIDQEHLGIPETSYDAEVTMSSSEFQKICRDLTVLGESVKIEVTKEGVRFSAEGEIGAGSVFLKPTSVGKINHEAKEEEDAEDEDEEAKQKPKVKAEVVDDDDEDEEMAKGGDDDEDKEDESEIGASAPSSSAGAHSHPRLGHSLTRAPSLPPPLPSQRSRSRRSSRS